LRSSEKNWYKLKISKSDRIHPKSLLSEAEKTPPRHSDLVSPFCLHASQFFQIESQKMSNIRPRTKFEKIYRASSSSMKI